MRIAQVAPLYESVPPALYGGTERIVAYLSDALTDLGHDVTLFASAGSQTKARLVPMRERPIRLDPKPLKSDIAAHLALLDAVRGRARKFDVLHFHLDLLHFPFFADMADRTLTTVHGRLDIADLPEAYNRWSQFGLVSISAHQRKPIPHASWIATIHHGLPEASLRFSPASGRYLAFLGRIAPEKRPDRAIRIAQQTGIPLRIAAKVDPSDRAYFERAIEPMLGRPGVNFIGEIDEGQKSEFLGGALALLFPIDWPEPFGLVMIEAMACGTPVIAWNNGSVSEVIEHGVSGFVVESEEDAKMAVHQASHIDRRKVRRAFERRFSATAMARKYVEVYRSMVLAGDSGKHLAVTEVAEPSTLQAPLDVAAE